MDKQKTVITLIVITILLPALKIFGIPGTGILICLAMLLISNFFMFIMPIARKKIKWRPNEESLEEEGPSKDSKTTIFFETILFFSLAIVTVGSLFAAQHWPGSVIMRNVGGISTMVAATALFIFARKSPYASQIESVCIAAALFALVAMTNFYWDFIFKTQHSDYHHLVEVYSNHSSKDPAKVKERQVELEKYYYHADSKSYNHMDSLLTKANALANDAVNARVLYILISDHEYSNQTGAVYCHRVFDNETFMGSEDIDRFAQDHRELFMGDTKFYVVTNNPEKATEELKKWSSENKQIIIVE